MESLQPQISILVHSLGWALLHSLWQGLLLYALLLMTFKMVPSASSRFKYNFALFTLAAAFLWFADTLVRYWENFRGVTIIISQPANGSIRQQIIHTTAQSGTFALNKFGEMLPWLEYAFPVVVSAYILGMIFFASLFFYNFFHSRELKKTGITQPTDAALDMLYEWKEKMNIAQPVKLFFSERVNVPMMIGAVKPVILIPLAMLTQLSPDQLETILVHELAHVKRRDYLVNIIQATLETILFFNPFIWLISTVIRREREHCCDDMVIGYITQPLSYAKALATLETYRLNPLAMTASGNKNQLLNRIKRMMEMKKEKFGYSILPLFILFIGLSLSLLWLSPTFAQSKKEKEKKEASTKKNDQKIQAAEIVIVDDKGQKKSYKSLDELSPAEREKVKEMLGDASITADHVEINIDEKEIQEAMKEAKKALKEANVEVREAMKEVNWEQISKDVNTAMAQSGKVVGAINWDSIGQTVRAAMNASGTKFPAVYWDSLGHVISASFDSMTSRIEISGDDIHIYNGPSGKQGSNSAYAYNTSGLDKGTVNAGSYEKMLVKMEKDGLIDRTEGYAVSRKKDKLYINGELQSQETYNRYKKYFDAEKIAITGNKNSISISTNN